ncbi:hypothetical protein U2181_15605, partial [Listeria monocytogenes]|uniref:hypothetical protein n=1 Tax=Listeria monocytogenes TaxID=1639 RepID=UPI002FDC0344
LKKGFDAKLEQLRPAINALIRSETGLWVIRGSKIKKPGFNAKWTDAEKLAVRKEFRDAGIVVYAPAGTTNTLSMDT